jgi:hypothetical protein
MSIQRSIEARSSNNYCRGRAIHIKYLSLVAQRVKHMRRITSSYVAHLVASYFPYFIKTFQSTIIVPTKCTSLLKAQDITICTLCLCILSPYMFQPTWAIFSGRNASA